MAKVNHVLGAWVDDAGAVVAIAGQQQVLRLVDGFAWQVSAGLQCVGRDGAPCPDGVSGVAQCRACFGPDRPECVFEPACAADPSHCACTFGVVRHAVYLAFHGILPKVGMTQERRVARRLSEQGADAYMVLATTPDRATARRLERDVARAYALPEWRAHTETLPQLSRPLPWDAIVRRADHWRGRLAGGLTGRLTPGPLHRLSHPLPQPLPGRPVRVATPGEHAGRWLGAKGPHAVYAERPRPDRLAVGDPPLAALSLPDLVGRTITLA